MREWFELEFVPLDSCFVVPFCWKSWKETWFCLTFSLGSWKWSAQNNNIILSDGLGVSRHTLPCCWHHVCCACDVCDRWTCDESSFAFYNWPEITKKVKWLNKECSLLKIHKSTILIDSHNSNWVLSEICLVLNDCTHLCGQISVIYCVSAITKTTVL